MFKYAPGLTTEDLSIKDFYIFYDEEKCGPVTCVLKNAKMTGVGTSSYGDCLTTNTYAQPNGSNLVSIGGYDDHNYDATYSIPAGGFL